MKSQAIINNSAKSSAGAREALAQVEHTASCMGLVLTSLLMRDVFKFEPAARIAALAMSTFRQVAVGNIPATAVMLITVDDETVTVHESYDEAVNFGSKISGRYIGIHISKVLKEVTFASMGPGYGSSRPTN
jgi:hypothetical protein